MASEKPCVFCNRIKFEERLIYENNHFYIIATLGQITNGGYVLLVPKKHVLCIGAMEYWEISGVINEAVWIQCHISQEYNCCPIMFEHGIVGQTIQHAHLHFVPAPLRLTERIRKDFPKAKMDIVPDLYWLREMYSSQGRRPYLFWKDSSHEFTICWNPPVPPAYLRMIIAEMLGCPERGDWRKMDPELDKRLWSETVTRLKKYYL